ncbi:unnamed protein product [Protopolystoma xenopodis]|uniref:Uncharacterized protein n=1 Tax=Protopolystoma xenopodis TaxID=117903 RepID=A0A3S5AXB9_9PLAT|nr:unnamed protein product [Protopolystoma xenopodis]
MSGSCDQISMLIALWVSSLNSFLDFADFYYRAVSLVIQALFTTPLAYVTQAILSQHIDRMPRRMSHLFSIWNSEPVRISQMHAHNSLRPKFVNSQQV